jgi:hypothetical protein
MSAELELSVSICGVHLYELRRKKTNEHWWAAVMKLVDSCWKLVIMPLAGLASRRRSQELRYLTNFHG